MMRRLLIFAFIILAFVVSCGKKEVKKVSDDSKLATEAFALAETIKDAYVKRDMDTLARNTTKEGLRTISGSMKVFDSAVVTFNPVWVEIDGDVINVNISWTGTWQKSGKTTEERGMAVFVMKGRPLKVDNVLRATPFKYPE